MSDTRYDVLCIGNAILDVIAQAEDSLVTELGMAKGGMTLIDEEAQARIYDRMGPAIESSGGSAANTAAALASLGARPAYIGKVADDFLGKTFTHDIRAIGVDFATDALYGGPATACCLILVTPDAQRTMNTFLGACAALTEADIDEEMVKNAEVTYLEGYLWDRAEAKAAMTKAAAIARQAGRKVALTLSDAFCVERHREGFLELLNGDVDILFANEAEVQTMFGAADAEAAVEHVRDLVETAVLTRGPEGAIVVRGDVVVSVPAEPVERLVDTTGAGDAFAAGFLFGYVRDLSPAMCARLGAVTAAEVISHFGPRPEAELAELVGPVMGVGQNP